MISRSDLNTVVSTQASLFGICLLAQAGVSDLSAQTGPQFSRVQPITNSEIALTLSGQPGTFYRIDSATDLGLWQAMATLGSGASSSIQYTDSATPFLAGRFYRAEQLADTNVFTGDYLSTTNGDIVMQPVVHATLVLYWQGKTIFVDPTNSVAPVGVPKADLVLVTHAHPDHFNAGAINGIRATNALIITSQDVYNQLAFAQRPLARVLGYGSTTNVLGLDVQAVPAYNSNHPFGLGNGYLLTIGGKRIFISGDTGNTPEMRALTNIDLAFVCMNQPFTMTVVDATNAVTAFRPKVVYPYHYRDSNGTATNAAAFKARLTPELGIEVRLRKWY